MRDFSSIFVAKSSVWQRALIASMFVVGSASADDLTISLAGTDVQPSTTIYAATGLLAPSCVDLRASLASNWTVEPGGGLSLTPASGLISTLCAPTKFTGVAVVTATSASDSTKSQSVDVVFSNHGGLFQRLIVGAEGSGGAATTPEGRYFTDIFLSTPLGSSKKEDDFAGPRWRLWVDTRITSAPQQFTAKVADFSIVSGVKDLQVNQVAQVFEMLGGVQVRLGGLSAPRKMFFDQSLSRTSFSLVAGYGGSTPFVPIDYVSSYDLPAQGSDAYARLSKQFGDVRTTHPNATTVAFVPPDRSRFWRQYYAGVRIQSHFFDAERVPSVLPMRTVDLLIGQNELVTGGRFHGPVLRADFFQPIKNFKERITVFVFGTASFTPGTGKNSSADALILNASAQKPDLTAPTTVLLTSPASNRDFFRFGIGIDLHQLFATPPTTQK